MGVALWMEVAEAPSADRCFEAARAAAQRRGDVEEGIFPRNQWRYLDNTLFPADQFAAARAEDYCGTWIQPGEANLQPVLGPRSPFCYALKIKPLKPGQTRLLFFGHRRGPYSGPRIQLPLPTAPSNPDDFRKT
jgi:hypothetical protein